MTEEPLQIDQIENVAFVEALDAHFAERERVHEYLRGYHKDITGAEGARVTPQVAKESLRSNADY